MKEFINDFKSIKWQTKKEVVKEYISVILWATTISATIFCTNIIAIKIYSLF